MDSFYVKEMFLLKDVYVKRDSFNKNVWEQKSECFLKKNEVAVK